MAAPQITQLPTPPSRSSPSNFSERADAFLGALPTFQGQVNALASWLDSTSSVAVAAAEAARDLALQYRDTAAGHASTASSAKAAAESARDLALGYRDAAGTHATGAGNSAAAAAGSATAAGNALTDFNTKWYGSRAAAPSGTIAEGALYFNTTTNGLHIRKGGVWVSAVAASFDELFALLKTRDGHGSGLDADTVDGLEGSQIQSNLNYHTSLEIGSQVDGAVSCYIDLHSNGNDRADYQARIIRSAGPNGTLGVIQTGAGDLQLQQSGTGIITFDGGHDLRRNGASIWHNDNAGVLSALGRIGSMALGHNNSGSYCNPGAVVAGGLISQVSLAPNESGAAFFTTHPILPGTWMSCGHCGVNNLGLFVRVA